MPSPGSQRFLRLKKKRLRSSWNGCCATLTSAKAVVSRLFRNYFCDRPNVNRPAVLLKERTLGIEIFGRDADDHTASDPIVRVTATEIRKRIAQYYQEPGHETELRLSLPSGRCSSVPLAPGS